MSPEPFFGDPASKARVWSRYAVLLGGLAATTPAHPAAFTLNDPPTVVDQWDPVGALPEDNPFTDGEESITPTEHTASGFGVYAVTYKGQKETIAFTAKETTLVTLGIIYDGSELTDAAGVISGKLKQRDPTKRYKAAFHRENGVEMERRVSENYAYIDSIARQSGNDESMVTVTLAIVPTVDRDLYDYYLGPKGA